MGEGKEEEERMRVRLMGERRIVESEERDMMRMRDGGKA